MDNVKTVPKGRRNFSIEKLHCYLKCQLLGQVLIIRHNMKHEPPSEPNSLSVLDASVVRDGETGRIKVNLSSLTALALLPF